MINFDKEEIRNYKIPDNFDLQDINNIQIIKLMLDNGFKFSNSSKSSKNYPILEDINKNKYVINLKKNTYFNTANSFDKGAPYHFIKNRLNGYLEVRNNLTSFEKRAVFVNAAKFLNLNKNTILKEEFKEKVKNKKKISVVIENNIKNINFFKTKNIEIKTIKHNIFKDFIKTGYLKDLEKNITYKIPNIAFPLYSIDNKINGYILRNIEKNNKKFRPVIGNHSSLWHSKLFKNPQKIFIAESSIDSISHFQLKKNKKEKIIYFSFHGNLYDSKLDNLILWLKKFNLEKTEIISINDNDFSGLIYDLKIYSKLNDEKLKISGLNEEKKYIIEIDFENHPLNKIGKWKLFIQDFRMLKIDFKLKEDKSKVYLFFPKKEINKKHFNSIFKIFKNKIFLNNKINIKLEKSLYKDWNEDLSKKKQMKNKL